MNLKLFLALVIASSYVQLNYSMVDALKKFAATEISLITVEKTIFESSKNLSGTSDHYYPFSKFPFIKYTKTSLINPNDSTVTIKYYLMPIPSVIALCSIIGIGGFIASYKKWFQK